MRYSFFILISIFLSFSYGCKEEEQREVHAECFALLDSAVTSMEAEMRPLEDEVGKLAAFTENLFIYRDEFAHKASKEQYKQSQSGVIYREAEGEGESSVYVSFLTPDAKKAIHQVYYTEALDSAFAAIQCNIPLVCQVYFNTRLQMCRIYPPVDVLNVFEEDLDLTMFNFYYMADEVRNPERKSKWVEDIYVDPAGRGWILSLIHPVFYNQELEGVIGLDITVNDLIDRFLSYGDKRLVLIDGEGNVVAGTSEAIELLNLPPLRNHTYVQTINADNFRKEDYNLFKSKSKEVRQMVSKFLLEKDNMYILGGEQRSHEYTVLCRQMNLLNWYVLELEG
ncbi:hypothetical protein GCM10028791_11120 [Echinicola sediminis]